jgi:hypothetical protein
MQARQRGANADEASASGRCVTVVPVSLRVRGAAPRAASRVLLSVFALALAALALIATPAIAAAPETPELTVKPIFASIAVFNGVLSPKGKVPAEGTYKFLYSASKTECVGGSETTPDPASGGAPKVLQPEQVGGLKPATEYTVCLQITNLASETATSLPVTFTTAAAAPPETPEALPPSDVNATSVTLGGVVDPHHEGEPGTYHFVYTKSSSVCTGGAETVNEPAPGSSPQPVSAAITAGELEPDTMYTFCLKATNALGESTLSPPVTFTTTSLPEMRTVEPVTNITGTTAILHGVLDPKAASPEALVEYDFFYIYAGGESSCNEPFVVKPALEPPGVASGAMGEAVEASLSGLTPDAEYAVCLGARNTGGAFDFSALSAPVMFKTVAPPPDVLSESVSERWATAVLLETRVNNEAEPTECFFQYGEASVSEHEVSCGDIEGYNEPTLSAKVEGLTAGHTYRWRTVAKNEAGTSDGKEESFTTATTAEPAELSIANFTWSPWVGVPMTAPANAGSEPEALFDWGACPTAGYCAGVGSYKDENGNREAMAATRIDGSWGQAVEIALPAGAATSGQNAGFGFAQPSGACTEPGDCVAVGHYINEGGDEVAMVVTETGGVWGAASEIKPPPNAASDPEASLGSLDCPAAGSCVARGEYSNEDGDREAMVAEETGGVWGVASDVELPANAASSSRSYFFRSNLGAVACSAAGSCVGVGQYRDSSTMTQEAMVVTEIGGNWAQASQIVLPANARSEPEARLDSVVCVTSGPCVADGSYINRSGDLEAMVAEETGGVWGSASQIQAPANVAVDPKIGFGLAPMPIACAASGACVITAEYTDSSGGQQAMVADETGGVWGPAREIAAPANAASNPHTVLDPACTASGACVVAGEYTDAGGDREAMVADEANGSWSLAREIAAPANAATNPEIIFGEVQCPAVGSCVAFGEYTNHTGVTRDMEVTGLEAPKNTAAPIVSGTAKVGQTLTCSEGTWIAASPTSYAYRWLRDGVAIGGAEANTYTVTAADEGHSISCEVTATDVVGSKSAVSANSVAIREEVRERREEEATAATKLQEEAAAKKKQEEAKIAVAGSVSLSESVLSVQSGGKASVELACTGTARCAGKLTLTVTSKGNGKHGKTAKAIGTAAFSIPAGKTGVVTITLTAAGRALLKAGHGKLGASLTIVKSAPAPTSTKRASVQLVQNKAAKAKKRKR